MSKIVPEIYSFKPAHASISKRQGMWAWLHTPEEY